MFVAGFYLYFTYIVYACVYICIYIHTSTCQYVVSVSAIRSLINWWVPTAPAGSRGPRFGQWPVPLHHPQTQARIAPLRRSQSIRFFVAPLFFFDFFWWEGERAQLEFMEIHRSNSSDAPWLSIKIWRNPDGPPFRQTTVIQCNEQISAVDRREESWTLTLAMDPQMAHQARDVANWLVISRILGYTYYFRLF